MDVGAVGEVGRSRPSEASCAASRPQPADRLQDLLLVHDVHLVATADLAQQRDGQLAAEMLAELAQAASSQPASVGVAPLQRRVPQVKAEPLEQPEDAPSSPSGSMPLCTE